jgi:nitrite transporter NirC
MIQHSVEQIAEAAVAKAKYLHECPSGYGILSVLAGAYLAFGITLIMSVGAPFVAAGSPAGKLVMGAAFGIALTLIVFVGAELFTGNNMVCAVGAFTRAISWATLARLFAWSWVGNLVGSFGVAWLVVQSGVLSHTPQIDVLMTVSASKMGLSHGELFFRGVLCNWLVCLALWGAARTTDQVAKQILIFWCLFAFVGSGFEHSIANQSLLGMALLLPHPDTVTWAGFVRNQLWVLAGNVVGGGVFVGGAYWLASLRLLSTEPAPSEKPALSAVAATRPS